jgi:hypothetical protein
VECVGLNGICVSHVEQQPPVSSAMTRKAGVRCPRR